MEQVPAQKIDIKVRRKWNGRGLIKTLVIVIILGYIGFIAFNFIAQYISNSLIQIDNIKIDILNDNVEVKGVLLKDETIINTPYNGKIKYIVPEGQRVRLGARVSNIAVADINASAGQSNFEVYAPVTGIVSYHFDGFENIYTPSNMDNLLMTQVEKLDYKESFTKDGNNVDRGKPLFKIVNNLARNQIYFHIPRNNVPEDLLKKNNVVHAEFEDKSLNEMIFVVDQLKTSGSDYIVILGNNSFIPKLLDQREVKMKIMTKSYQGAIVSKNSLVKGKDKDGSFKDGLYYQYKEEVRWKRVEIIGSVKDKVAVTGIEEGTPYIVNPERTSVGQVISH